VGRWAPCNDATSSAGRGPASTTSRSIIGRLERSLGLLALLRLEVVLIQALSVGRELRSRLPADLLEEAVHAVMHGSALRLARRGRVALL